MLILYKCREVYQGKLDVYYHKIKVYLNSTNNNTSEMFNNNNNNNNNTQ